MDYHNDNESWAWHGEDYYVQNECNLVDMSKCACDGVTENEEDISYMFEETTPIKACGDLSYLFDDSGIMSKTPQECRENSSQVKKRRILNFNIVNEDVASSFLKSKERMDFLNEIHPEISQWEACLEHISPPGLEDLGQSEAWLADCLNDTDMNISSGDGTVQVNSDFQIGTKEVCNLAPDCGHNMVQRTVRSSHNVTFKGRKSYMRTPTKLAASVAYPFDFIKPCGVRGDVTLKDINQRILTPPPSRPKQVSEDPQVMYPTSAFSGKPVVGRTKIPTQGGKGSITIMRTKG